VRKPQNYQAYLKLFFNKKDVREKFDAEWATEIKKGAKPNQQVSRTSPKTLKLELMSIAYSFSVKIST
jgi:hypothetical protein